jgi:hypothetical protein
MNDAKSFSFTIKDWLFKKKDSVLFCASAQKMLRSLKNKIPTQMGIADKIH